MHQRARGQKSRHETKYAKIIASVICGDSSGKMIRNNTIFNKVRNMEYDYNGKNILSLDISTKKGINFDRISQEAHAKTYGVGWTIFGGESGYIPYTKKNPSVFIDEVKKLFSKAGLVITFNGKTFDGVILRTLGVGIEEHECEHYDLLNAVSIHLHNKSLNEYAILNNLPEKTVVEFHKDKDIWNLRRKNAAIDDTKLTLALFVKLSHMGLKYNKDESSKGLITRIGKGIQCVGNNDKLYQGHHQIMFEFLRKYGLFDNS